MNYEIEYSGKKVKFDSNNKAGEITDKINGTTRTVPIFMVGNVSEDINDDEEIKKKVSDALLETKFAGIKGKKGIKILEDRTEVANIIKNKKSKKNKVDEEGNLYFVELKILGTIGNDRTGFNPGQWRAIGVLDPKSKGFDKDGAEKSVGAIYLFETTSGKKDKTKETEDLTNIIKTRYKGDCRPGNSAEKPNAGGFGKNKKGRI